MKKTLITLAKKISKKFVTLLLSALATAVGELVIGGVLKGFTKIKEHRKSEPTVDIKPEAEVENEVVETEEVEDKVETEEVEDKVETEEELEKMENEEN